MVVSKLGQHSEWRGVSVMSVCVFVVRHRLSVSLSVCLTAGGYACVAARRYVPVVLCPICVSATGTSRGPKGPGCPSAIWCWAGSVQQVFSENSCGCK